VKEEIYKDIAARILYEDNHVLVFNKKAGEIVQGDKTGDLPLSELLKLYLKKKHNKPGNVFMGVVHRLDRPVSGALVFAKTSKALSRLNESLRQREINKTYWAVCNNKPDPLSGRLEHFLRKNQKQNKSYVVGHESKDALQAILEYNFLLSSDKYHLLEVQLLTGRHHQIRVQLAHMGCIIKGDLKYGAKTSNKDASIHLHARKLQFVHPVKKENIQITAPAPNDALWKYFESKIKESNG